MLAPHNNLSLRTKLILISVVSIFVALSIIFGAYAIRDAEQSKDDFLRRQLILAHVIAQNTRAALAFRDAERTERTLATLSAEPSVVRATLFDEGDEPLATYPEASALPTDVSRVGGKEYLFEDQVLHIDVPVVLDDKVIGHLYVQTSLDELNQDIWMNAVSFLIISIIASALAALLAFFMQRSVTGRVTTLARLADHVSRGGSHVHFDIQDRFGKDEVGYLGNAFVDMLDKLEKRESDIKESEDRYRTLVESSPFSILEFDTEGNVLSSNSGGLFNEFFFDELEGINSFSLIDRKSRLRVFRNWKKVLRGVPVEFDLDLMVDGKLVNTTTSLTPIRDTNGAICKVMGITQDISHRVSLERQLRHAQKMEAIGQLTGGVAHDLNNILGIMVGNIELLKLVGESNAESMERIAEIEHSVQRAEKLTTQLLGFTRAKPFELEPTNLNDCIRRQKTLYESSMTPDIDVKYRLAEDLWDIEINRGDFEDAMLNLIINARDAMSGRGRLVIETENKMLDQSFCDNRTDLVPGEHVEVTVTDDGEGMSADVLEHAFEPFFTTKGVGEGSGLGLSMVFGFVRRSKGGIRVYSEPGIGTTFRLYFPRTPSVGEKPIEQAAVVVANPPRGTERILAVDDEQALLELSCRQLENLGYSVVCATTGEQALGILRSRSDIDLLFSDVVMPGGLNGFELAAKVNEEFVDTRVLLMSGFPGGAEMHEGKAAFTGRILKKPFTLDDLANAVRQSLDGGDGSTSAGG